VGEALILGSLMGLVGMALLTVLPEKVLGLVLPALAPAREFALPYLKIRGATWDAI